MKGQGWGRWLATGSMGRQSLHAGLDGATTVGCFWAAAPVLGHPSLSLCPYAGLEAPMPGPR